MARKILKSSQASQILFKENWRMLSGGGFWLDYVEDQKGDDLLVPVGLNEIVPGQQYYMQQVAKPNHFRPTVFHHTVKWESIVEIHKTGRIWKRKQ